MFEQFSLGWVDFFHQLCYIDYRSQSISVGFGESRSCCGSDPGFYFFYRDRHIQLAASFFFLFHKKLHRHDCFPVFVCAQQRNPLF